jgi:hypothetical protein
MVSTLAVPKMYWKRYTLRKIVRIYASAVRKVSVHFEYLENRSRVFDENWQQVRRDLTAHP